MSTRTEFEAEEAAIAAELDDTPRSIFDVILYWPEEPTAPAGVLIAQIAAPACSAFIDLWPAPEGGWIVRADGEDRSPTLPSFGLAHEVARAIVGILVAIARAPDARAAGAART